jgi:hypothetical protein
MKGYFLNRKKSRSLTAQIRAMEQMILQRQQVIPMLGDSLVRKIRQQLTAPTSLLFASGIGFFFGELTQRRPQQASGTSDKPTTAGSSPLTTALNFIGTARTLYMALPIAWMLKPSKQQAQAQAAERRYRRVATTAPRQTVVKGQGSS